MSDIPRVAKPMIGWAVGTQLCDHDIPVAVCDWCEDES